MTKPNLRVGLGISLVFAGAIGAIYLGCTQQSAPKDQPSSTIKETIGDDKEPQTAKRADMPKQPEGKEPRVVDKPPDTAWSLPVTAGSLRIRAGASEEITEKRSIQEDCLRIRVLEAVEDQQMIDELRKALNQPWTIEGVRAIASMVTKEKVDAYGSTCSVLGNQQKGRMLDLLAYVTAQYKEGPVGDEIAKVFDQVYEMAARGGGENARFWSMAINAITDYGSSKLLTPGFWKGYTNGMSAPRVFEAVGDKDVLSKLEDYKRRQVFHNGSIADSVHEQVLDDNIILLKAELLDPDLKKEEPNRLNRLRKARAMILEQREPAK